MSEKVGYQSAMDQEQADSLAHELVPYFQAMKLDPRTGKLVDINPEDIAHNCANHLLTSVLPAYLKKNQYSVDRRLRTQLIYIALIVWVVVGWICAACLADNGIILPAIFVAVTLACTMIALLLTVGLCLHVEKYDITL